MRAPGGDQVGVLALGREKADAGSEAGLLNGPGDIEDVEAFRNDQRDGEDVAAMQAVVYLHRRGCVIELVLARLEDSAAFELQRLELIAGAQYAGLFEPAADLQGAGAGRDVDELLGAGTVGHHEEKGQCRSRYDDQQEQKLEDSRYSPHRDGTSPQTV